MSTSSTNTVTFEPTESGLGSSPGVSFTDPVPGLSTSPSDRLAQAFSSSPIHSGEMTPEGVRANFINLVQNGEVQNGFMFDAFNRDYAANGVSDPSSVEGSPNGGPANGFTPNIASPGEGNGVNPISLPEPPNKDASDKSITTPFEGEGSQTSLTETSAVIGGSTIGDYILGHGTEFAS